MSSPAPTPHRLSRRHVVSTGAALAAGIASGLAVTAAPAAAAASEGHRVPSGPPAPNRPCGSSCPARPAVTPSAPWPCTSATVAAAIHG